MIDLVELLPPGWSMNVTHDDQKNICRFIFTDNIGAYNEVSISSEALTDTKFTNIMLKETIEQINKLYGL